MTGLIAGAVCAAQEQPVAVLLGVRGEVEWFGDSSFLDAVAGQTLHSGDVLRSGAEPLTFLFCPERARVTLAPRSAVRLGERRLEVLAGKIAARTTVDRCVLPAVPRRMAAADYHAGESLYRVPGMADAQPPPIGEALNRLAPERASAVRALLVPLEETLRADPSNVAARLEKVTVLERNGLGVQSLPELQELRRVWPDAPWLRSRIFVQTEDHRPPEPEGRTHGLVIGISRYRKREPENTIDSLRFAHRDAELFRRYLESVRGGSVKDIRFLTNEQATLAAIQNGFDQLLKGSLGPRDTVVIFISGHATSENGVGYILAHDSDPRAFSTTALRMSYLMNLIGRALEKTARVVVYVDVCRAGLLGLSGEKNRIYSLLPFMEKGARSLLIFTACEPGQVSVEDVKYGAGHGAFTYYLHRGLNGAADRNHDETVTTRELVRYVANEVSANTPNDQNPQPYGVLDFDLKVSELLLPGPPPEPPGLPAHTILAQQRGEGDPARVAGSGSRGVEALLARRLEMEPAEYLFEAARLRVELEDAGQDVLLRYLQGEQQPLTAVDFERCAQAFTAAGKLTPESLWVDARRLFCEGRGRIFNRDYSEAIRELQESIRLDQAGAYAYNALGIAYLEMANYDRAIAAFRDAISRGPYWAYAWHNLAVVLTQLGRYDEAVRAYRRAIELAPSAAYLRYNVAVLYQVLNRRREAELAFADLREHFPDAKVSNAFGTLRAAEGRRREAEQLFREALSRDPEMLEAAHNLALLLAAQRKRREEAIALWRANVAKAPQHLPSLYGLAETLARAGRTAEALDAYAAILRIEPSATVRHRIEKLERQQRHSNPSPNRQQE